MKQKIINIANRTLKGISKFTLKIIANSINLRKGKKLNLNKYKELT